MNRFIHHKLHSRVKIRFQQKPRFTRTQCETWGFEEKLFVRQANFHHDQGFPQRKNTWHSPALGDS